MDVRTWTQVEFCSTWLLGSMQKCGAASEGFDREGRIGPFDVDALGFGLAVGIDLQLNRHAEKIHVLCDSPTTRKPFCVRYTVYLFLNSGAPVEFEPLGEEPGQSLSRGLFRHLAEVVNGDRISGVLRDEARMVLS